MEKRRKSPSPGGGILMPGKIVINRRTESEIDQAIEILEKRGYKLVAKKPIQHLNNVYNWNAGKKRFSNISQRTSWRAVMVGGK